MVGLNWKNLKQKLLPRSLFGRSLMIIVIPVLLMQMVVAYIFFNRHWDSMSDKLVFALVGEIEMMTHQIEQSPSSAVTLKMIKDASTGLDILVSVERQKPNAIVPMKKGSIALYSIEEKLQAALKQKLTLPFYINASPQDRWFEITVQLDKHTVVKFLCYKRRLTSPTTYIFVLWLVGISILLMLVSVLFLRNQIRPIRRLALAAEKLGKGQDITILKPEGAREVRQAARAFLEMRDRIRRQIEQRTILLAGVSHDLRTPLTRMKLQLAMMKESTEIANLRQDLDDMEKMLEGYLTFAKGDGNEASETADLSAILERIVGNARRQGADIQASYGGRILIKIRPIAIERALANIINNAQKYASHIWINIYEQSEMVEITIDDDGKGIAPEQRAEVFKPFYRLEKSRNPKTGGIGLGLSIAQDIIHSHGGEIFLEDSNRGGLRVVVKLPL